MLTTNSKRRLITVCLCVLLAGLTIPLRAQTGRVDARQFGFDIPPGAVTLGGQTVVTADESGAMVTAKTHVNVGDFCIVLLPDGHLAARRQNDATVTERPFEPISKESLAKRMRAEMPGFKVKQGTRHLFVYNASEEFATVASRILQSMYPGVAGYAKQQKIKTHEPVVPLVAIMFRTEQEFQNYQRMPQGVVAYYNSLTNRVVMYEESRLKKIKPELAIQQSLATIAHEGAHQILHNIGVQQRLSIWPMWLSEGLAEFFAPTTFGRRLVWKGAGQVNDMRMFELEQYLKSRDADQPDRQMIEQTIMAARLTSTGYASAWSLTHYLAKLKRAEFNNYVREVSRLGPLESSGDIVSPGVIPANTALFKKHFGSDFDDLNKRVVAHLKNLPYKDPFAEWPHFVATLAVPDGRKAKRNANIFHSPQMAQKWLQETLASVTANQRRAAQTQVREFPNRLIASRFARTWLGQ